nr:integrase, catalytic region, zinc finger, CCHC-type, peptidase aspartic, catalytic [Tanacetum cinerariifolium]
MVEEVTSLKKDFKQKENQYLEEFFDMKALKEKVEDKLFKQDQSLQIVHMLCKPKPYYDEQRKVVIGYKSPLCLTRAKQGIQKALTTEIKEIKTIFDELEAEVDQNAVNKKCDEIERKNLLISNDTLIANCLSKEEFYIATNSELNVSRFSEMHEAQTVVQTRYLELETELSKLKDKIQKDDHDVMVKRFSNLKVQYLNLQLKYQHLKENLGNNSLTAQDGFVTPKVLAPGMYAIDVELIPPRLRNNREVHLDYLKHLKESVATLREIVEEAKATTLLNRKKQVTFADQRETSNTNTQKHVEQQITQKTNVLVLPSTRVDSCTDASGSKPRSNTKKNRISPAKSVNKKTVEDHTKTNKSHLQKPNRVDSSISSKRTVINSNSDSVCKTCNKCFILANHDMCVIKYLNFVNAPSFAKNVVCKVKQPTERIFTLGEQCPLTRVTPPKVVPAMQPENVSTSRTYRPLVLDSGCSKHITWDRSRHRNFVKKFIGTVRFRNDHFGAIMGYEDYVIGNIVISRLYYVEGLGHNLFFVGQFCDSDLEVAFTKHSCYVRDTNGVDLIKGSRGSNLYTISIEDMMKSSLICLLSKASKTKLWLWHHRLNHLNFGTINDLARKDLYRTCSYIFDARTDKFRARTESGFCGTLCTPTNKDLDILFQPMFDEYLEPPRVDRPVSPALAVPVHVNSAGTPSSTAID